MNFLGNRINHIALTTVKIISMLLTGTLVLCGLFLTCYATDMESQLVLTRFDQILLTLPGTAVLFLLMLLVRKAVAPAPGRRNLILLCLILGWYLLAGLILVLFSKTVPAGDCMSVYSAAEQLALGNTGVIHPTASYLSYYPQQTGLLAYFEVIIRFWKLLPISLPAYHIIKCVNIVWVCLSILFQYKSVKLLFHSDQAATTYLMLVLLNLPLLMYTSFVYGEIPSFALFTIGLWALLKLLLPDRELQNAKNRSNKRSHSDFFSPSFLLPAFICTLCFAGSIALRKNTMVLMIAVIIVTLLEALRRRKLSLLVLTLCFLLATLLPLPAITSYYEHRAGNELLTGVPPMSYFAMGMQESSRADGWYNGFNFYTYQETGMDTQATNELSRQAIQERLTYFKENPGYAAQFYRNKFLSQWADGTYASRQATLATFGGRREFFVRLYEGDYSTYYIEFCNLFQNLLYLGSAVFCACALLSKKVSSAPKTSAAACAFLASMQQENRKPAFHKLPVYIGLIGVIGGFLFHMIWEANARYILPYSLLLLPYAAWGLNLLLSLVDTQRKARK